MICVILTAGQEAAHERAVQMADIAQLEQRVDARLDSILTAIHALSLDSRGGGGAADFLNQRAVPPPPSPRISGQVQLPRAAPRATGLQELTST